uniref:Gingipain domain-containing protein n=1 Tax=candidate division WOR-3 bacterium TaxID=2052148 RepID=A0A7C6ED63_UNCW3
MQKLIAYLLKLRVKNLALGIILFLAPSILAQESGARYLVIAYDNFVDAVRPLVEWKTKKGVKAVCVPLSQIGSTPSQIKSYIQNAYYTWNPRPEYVLLVGSPDLLPSYSNQYDDYYADMMGNYQIELCIGRFHCQTLVQCSLLVAKSIGYEKSATMQDSTWFAKGTTIVREDNPPDPYYQSDCRYIRNLWLAANYTHIDSFINTAGHNQSDVENAITNGRAFVVYRGQAVSYWWSPFNVSPNNTNNGYKLPIVISGTCATMSLSPGENMLGDAFVRAGTVQNPKGAVAFFGTTVVGSHVSQYRGAVTWGFFKALYLDSIFTLGGAAKRAKFIMDSLYPSQIRYMEWNLLGDPELNVWTTKPRKLTVSYDTMIFVQPTNLSVLVTSSGAPVSGALVCVKMDSTVYSYGYTDNQGLVTLAFTPQHIGYLSLTVSGHNLFPCEESVLVRVGNIPYLRYHHSVFTDSPPGGNGNLRINPGEEILLTCYLINSGNLGASGVRATLRSYDEFVTISESTSSFADIGPGSIVQADSPYRFALSENTPNGHELSFNLHITDDANHSWDSPFSLPVQAGELVYSGSFVIDSSPGGNNNGQIGAQENIRLRLTVLNSGAEDLNNVYARLRTNSPYLSITDSFGYFGSVPSGANRTNTQDPFAFSTAPSLPRNYPLSFVVFVYGSGGTYNYRTTFAFTLYSEQGMSSDPTGPDSYGYYCYDNMDISSGRAPSYEWLEIAPPGPGTIIEQITNADAGIDTLPLPFTFRYYGANYNEVTVASNGFLSIGRTNYRWGNNSPIPDTAGPEAMIAPFWDDLNANETLHGGNGDIYQYYDAVNHRWIVEFKDVAHYDRNSVRETFQVILFDPAYYPTPTNDGEIVFQYQNVADATSNTVGIENPTETDGIQYLFNNNYPSTAALLTNGRALRFTTLAPATTSPWLVLLGITVSDSVGGNNNRIPEPGENIQLVVNLVNRGQGPAENVFAQLRSTDNNAILIDSTSGFGTIGVSGQGNNEQDPYLFTVRSQVTDTILDFLLTINATGYNTVQYFSIGLFGNPGIVDCFPPSADLGGLQCFPNPFRQSTMIKTNLTNIAIYDLTGKLVVRLPLSVDRCPLSVLRSRSTVTVHGPQLMIWDGTDEQGRKLGSGIYFILAKSANGNQTEVKKITISR